MPTHPSFKSNAVVLITGGASGIGLAFAKLCHGYGMRIALADINTAALSIAITSILLPSHSADDPLSERDSVSLTEGTIKPYTVDVSQSSDWADLKERVETDLGPPSLLFLNAGVAPKSDWEDVSKFETIMQTNYFGVVNGITTFLPSLRAQEPNPTAVIITGSKQGITNPPGNPAYNASKAAIKSLAESLSYGLRDTTTDVFLLVPGWTHTALTKRMLPASKQDEKPEGAWSPEQVVEFLEGKMAMGKEKGFYAICPDNDVTEEMDRKRVMWAAGDITEGRPPLSRWREGWKEEAAAFMKKG